MMAPHVRRLPPPEAFESGECPEYEDVIHRYPRGTDRKDRDVIERLKRSRTDKAFDPNQPRDAEGQWTSLSGLGRSFATTPEGPGNLHAGVLVAAGEGSADAKARTGKDVARIRKATPELVDHLTDSELVAVRAYVGPGYYQYNGLLRGEVTFEPAAETIMKRSTSELVSGMEKLPAVKGMYYRGQLGNYAEHLSVGQTLSDKGFLSASADRTIAEHFARLKPKSHSTVFEIKGRSARNVSALSRSKKQEQEHVFMPGTSFKVTEVTPGTGGKSYDVIHLQEV